MKDVDGRVRGINEYQVDPNYVLDKLAELEGRSRRKNLRIDGINEEKDETCEMCDTNIKNIFKENLEIHKGITVDVFIKQKKKQLEII